MIKKLSLILTLLIKSFALFSQTDSTIIYYKYLEDKDLINICELTGIQIQKIYCEDTLLKGKVFNNAIKEFKKGKINTNINLNINDQKTKNSFINEWRYNVLRDRLHG